MSVAKHYKFALSYHEFLKNCKFPSGVAEWLVSFLWTVEQRQSASQVGAYCLAPGMRAGEVFLKSWKKGNNGGHLGNWFSL